MIGHFNTLLSVVDRPSWKENNKDIVDLHRTTNELELIDFYRIFHPTTIDKHAF